MKRRDKIGNKDSSLWAQITKDVKPLPGRRPRKTGCASEDKSGKALALSPKPTTPATSSALAPKIKKDLSNSSMDRRTAQKLKRGQIAIAAKLDLHGHTQASAHKVLRQFLQRAYETGNRCVLIVTGKGKLGEGGVLRRAVPRWLEEKPFTDWVLSHAPAKPRDGGEGAVYVYVRRRK